MKSTYYSLYSNNYRKIYDIFEYSNIEIKIQFYKMQTKSRSARNLYLCLNNISIYSTCQYLWLHSIPNEHIRYHLCAQAYRTKNEIKNAGHSTLKTSKMLAVNGCNNLEPLFSIHCCSKQTPA